MVEENDSNLDKSFGPLQQQQRGIIPYYVADVVILDINYTN